MTTTEKLQAIRSKCERLLKHANDEPQSFKDSEVAALKSTVAAIDELLATDGANYKCADAILAAWEGLA